jgi:hypothetical protein
MSGRPIQYRNHGYLVQDCTYASRLFEERPGYSEGTCSTTREPRARIAWKFLVRLALHSCVRFSWVLECILK